MKFEKVRLYVSSPRIARFLIATGNSKVKAVRLYKANLKVSQAFLPVLAILEVTLRNRLNAILSGHFSDPDWIINQKTGFMVHHSLTYVRRGRTIHNLYLKKQVEKAETRIRNSGMPATSGKIISEQTFGFWTELFERTYYRILLGRPIQIFTNLPSGHGRNEVIDALNQIRIFRNRLYHNEPVCFNAGAISFQKAEDIHSLIKDVLSWCDPDLISRIKDVDQIVVKIRNAKKI
jgi:hypothetical protein